MIKIAAVTVDHLDRQTEVAALKRASYTPLRAHSGWTVRLVVIVVGFRGVIHPAVGSSGSVRS